LTEGEDEFICGFTMTERRKPGTKPKDSAITDNPNLSKREIAALKSRRVRILIDRF